MSDEEPDTIGPGERLCPVCGECMQVEAKRGVSVDVCSKHGVWLDSGELDKILLARSPKTQRRRRGSHERVRRAGASAGFRHGWLALLED